MTVASPRPWAALVLSNKTVLLRHDQQVGPDALKTDEDIPDLLVHAPKEVSGNSNAVSFKPGDRAAPTRTTIRFLDFKFIANTTGDLELRANKPEKLGKLLGPTEPWEAWRMYLVNAMVVNGERRLYVHQTIYTNE